MLNERVSENRLTNCGQGMKGTDQIALHFNCVDISLGAMHSTQYAALLRPTGALLQGAIAIAYCAPWNTREALNV